MSAYAKGTEVPYDRTRNDLERLLATNGATNFAYMSTADAAIVAFSIHDRTLRFRVALPTLGDAEISRTPTGRSRTHTQARQNLEAETRRRWRALLLIVRAKLEAVETGITTFEAEFFGNTVMADGRTVYETAGPALEASIAAGQIPSRLELGVN